MSTASRARAMAVVTVVGVIAAGGCGDDGVESQAIPVVEVVASEYLFTTPADVEGGLVRLALDNRGARVHIAQLARIDDGHTVYDVVDLLQAFEDGNAQAAPDWFHQTGIDFAPLGPGRRSAIVTDLDEGTYVIFCLLTAPGGAHALHGMVSSFTVTRTRTGTATLPEVDATLVVDDDGFTLAPVKAGRQLVALRNEGTRAHEFAFGQLHAGATFDQAGAFIQEGQVGELPAEFAGGAQSVEPGATMFVEIDLEAGEWTVVDVGDEGVLTGTLTVG